ncbi:hypothetical protein GCM10007063_31270 [Lentibacillus kapialis]|uniref:Transcobalamin-like C-terminal domain-containing protein n=1 Tax=Lentibacillus kapialis TaxID=340214 RepID=A0A917Q396_9BACI|nr:DUF4430 domain-containing protein [Lentibacillus kapialis]GGK06468.1 hypothetical protein GCM10007063_31270 [Lentibacillus kapialis]
MSKWFLRIVSILMTLAVITGCGAGGEEQSESNNNHTQTSTNENADGELGEDEIRITISKDNGSEYIAEKEIEIKEDAILMDVMQKNFYVKTKDNGQFITSIERVSADEDEQKAWMFEVNGEMANVGAAEYELSPGDKVIFDLQAWE